MHRALGAAGPSRSSTGPTSSRPTSAPSARSSGPSSSHTLQDYDKLVAARKQEQEDEELEQEQLLWEVCAKEKELGCLWSTLEREREQRKQLEASYDEQHTQPFVLHL